LVHSRHLIGPRFTAGLLLSLILLALSAVAPAQRPASGTSEDRERGIQLYQQGDFPGAVKALRSATDKNKTDLAAWHWLGLTLERQGRPGDARKAHEKSARLGEDLLMGELESSGSPRMVISKLKSLIEPAADSADAYVRLGPKLSNKKSQEWNERREFLRDYADYPEVGGFPIYSGKEVTTKARVLSKPEPTYTEEARRHQVTGTVVVKAIFAGDGKVRGIVAVSRLPHGLTAMAIRSARQIKFIPATKDGHPVSMWMQLEYNFNLY
jgi:tetratricopeptide (TPR) repeat protein